MCEQLHTRPGGFIQWWTLSARSVVPTASAGIAVGCVFIGSLSTANRLAPAERRGQVVSSYFVLCYLGLAVQEQGRFGEYFDRVSDALRNYLGARYGFDGLESTTDEIITALQRSSVHGVAVPEIVAFLQDCDLVKFANMTPTQAECVGALTSGERIVRATMPRHRAFDATPLAEGRAG